MSLPRKPRVTKPGIPELNGASFQPSAFDYCKVEQVVYYFLRRSLRATYTIPKPLASRARLDGSGTGRNVAPAKAAGVAVQTAMSEASETGTKRLIIISIQRG